MKLCGEHEKELWRQSHAAGIIAEAIENFVYRPSSSGRYRQPVTAVEHADRAVEEYRKRAED